MRKRIKVLVLLGLGCMTVLLALTVLVPGEKEPTYQGRTLTQWLEQRTAPVFTLGPSSTNDPVIADALRHMGTNVFPVLIKWVAYEPPTWRGPLDRLCIKFPALRRNGFVDSTFYMRDRQSGMAATAFHLLDSGAAPALPLLARIAANTNHVYAAKNAEQCIRVILETGCYYPVLWHPGPLVTRALSDPDPIIRKVATNVMDTVNSFGGLPD